MSHCLLQNDPPLCRPVPNPFAKDAQGQGQCYNSDEDTGLCPESGDIAYAGDPRNDAIQKSWQVISTRGQTSSSLSTRTECDDVLQTVHKQQRVGGNRKVTILSRVSDQTP